MDDALAILVAEGKPASVIAGIMSGRFGRSLTRNSIIGRAYRNKNKLGGRPAWSTAMDARLRAGSERGESAAVIAAGIRKFLGIPLSADAVRGRAKRLDLVLLKAPRIPRLRRPPRPTVIQSAPRKVRIMQPVEPPDPTPFLVVREFQCRRLLGGDEHLPAPERLVCGAPVKRGSPFRFCVACHEWLMSPSTRRAA
jgi:hypothetical protein